MADLSNNKGGNVTGPRAWVLQQLDAERGRWMLWLPAALGLGIAIYFDGRWTENGTRKIGPDQQNQLDL